MPENNDHIKDLKQENEQLKSELDSYKQRDEQHKNIRWWTARKFTGLILGKNLKTSVKTVVNEVSEDKKVSKDALSDLITSLIKRITRVGAITILLALLPTLILLVQTGILYQQNKRIDTQIGLVKNQNKLIEKQNTRLDQQTYLQEAERRSSLVFLFSNIMDAIDTELKEDIGEKGKRDLSPQLVGRIVALSTRLKPYYYMENDKLIDSPVSPERVQLLLSLIESELDTSTLSKIYKKADFSYSDLSEVNLNNAFLSGINLTHTYIELTELKGANLSQANMSGSVMYNVDFIDTDLSGVNFWNAEIIANFSNSNLDRARLRNALLEACFFETVSFVNADMESANLSYSEILNSDLSRANFNNANLAHIEIENSLFHRTRLTNANLNNARLTCVNLNDSKLNNSNLINANLAGLTLWGVNFENADMRYTNLISSDLFLANLKNVNLRGTYLNDADLTGVKVDTTFLSYLKNRNSDSIVGAHYISKNYSVDLRNNGQYILQKQKRSPLVR